MRIPIGNRDRRPAPGDDNPRVIAGFLLRWAAPGGRPSGAEPGTGRTAAPQAKRRAAGPLPQAAPAAELGDRTGRPAARGAPVAPLAALAPARWIGRPGPGGRPQVAATGGRPARRPAPGSRPARRSLARKPRPAVVQADEQSESFATGDRFPAPGSRPALGRGARRPVVFRHRIGQRPARGLVLSVQTTPRSWKDEPVSRCAVAMLLNAVARRPCGRTPQRPIWSFWFPLRCSSCGKSSALP